jgi:hypothetical protein
MAASKSRLVAAITIRSDGPSSTDTFEFMFLQNTQQSDLSLGWKLAYFIEEDRASFSHQARRSIPGADRGCYSMKYDRQD